MTANFLLNQDEVIGVDLKHCSGDTIVNFGIGVGGYVY